MFRKSFETINKNNPKVKTIKPKECSVSSKNACIHLTGSGLAVKLDKCRKGAHAKPFEFGAQHCNFLRLSLGEVDELAPLDNVPVTIFTVHVIQLFS